MNIHELGREGEQEARIKLKEQGYWIGQLDWLAKKDGRWTKFEIKKKERFIAPPFDGHGLDLRQVIYSAELQEDTGIRTILMVCEIPEGIWYWNYLDELEKGEKFDTRNGVRIYNLNNFKLWTTQNN